MVGLTCGQSPQVHRQLRCRDALEAPGSLVIHTSCPERMVKEKKERKNERFVHLLGGGVIDSTQHVWPSGHSSVCCWQSGSTLQSLLQQPSASHDIGSQRTSIPVLGGGGITPPKNLPMSLSPGKQLLSPMEIAPVYVAKAVLGGGGVDDTILHVPPASVSQLFCCWHSASWLSTTPLQLWSLPSAQFTGAPGKVVASVSSQSLPHGPLRNPSRSASTLHASSSQSVCILQSLSWPSEQAVTKSLPAISDAKTPSCCLHCCKQFLGGFGPNALSGPMPHAAWQHPTS